MAAVIDNNEAVLRQQGQREVDADSRCNNQIKTMAAAVAATAGGDGGRIRVMAAIDDGGNGKQ
jgi:hypothetical protein